MPLVQSPIPMDGDPREIHTIEHDPESPDGPLEDRGEGEIEFKTVLLKGTPGLPCLFHAMFAQINIRPAAEAVLLVPDALSVA